MKAAPPRLSPRYSNALRIGLGLLLSAIQGCNATSIPDGQAGYVLCGDSACDVRMGAACCQQLDSGVCGAPGECLGGTLLYCDGPEDCKTGSACCMNIRNSNSIASCSAPGASACPGLSIVCHSGSDCPYNQSHCCHNGQLGYCYATLDPNTRCD